MSLTSYRAAPPRDPKDRHHIALTFAARKCYYEQCLAQGHDLKLLRFTRHRKPLKRLGSLFACHTHLAEARC